MVEDEKDSRTEIGGGCPDSRKVEYMIYLG